MEEQLLNSELTINPSIPTEEIANAVLPPEEISSEPPELVETAEFAPNRVIVKFNPAINASEITSLQAEIGVRTVKKAENLGIEIWQLEAGEAQEIVSTYENDPRFEFIELDYVIKLEDTERTTRPQDDSAPITAQSTTPNDSDFSQLWGLNNTGQTGGTSDADIDASEAWKIQTGNPDFVVGVIDTGVDYNHPDLVNNIWNNPGEIAGDGIDNDSNGYIDDIRGWDFVNNDNNPMDDHGHGTHVAGTIAGEGNNGIGVTGVAQNAKIMPLKFLNASGSGFISNAILATNYATNQGVKLTNNSWGGGGYSNGLYNAIKTAGEQGALFIAAAGNGGFDGIGDNNDIIPNYPANYDLPNVISVASTDHNDNLSSFSNYGATTVDLGAPGEDIYSTWIGGSYKTISGTSMATPHTTGAAVLLWSEDSTLSKEEVKDALMQKTDFLSSLDGKTVSDGRLNINSALLANVPTVTVNVSPTTVQEDGESNLVYTFSRTDENLTTPLTVNFAIGGTANGVEIESDPADYTLLTNSDVTFNPDTRTGTVTFNPDVTTVEVSVDPTSDTLEESENETVVVDLGSGDGYLNGTPQTAIGNIVSEEVIALPTQFINPSFEENSFEGWETQGVASIETSGFGSTPTEGTYQALIKNSFGSIPDAELEAVLGLSSGSLDALGNGNATEGSALAQTLELKAGDILSFDWNYLTNEGSNSFFNDFGFVAIESDSLSTVANTSTLLLPFTNPAFAEETGYGTYTYTIPSDGTYSIAVGIMDVEDEVVDSGLLVDNFSIESITSATPGPDNLVGTPNPDVIDGLEGNDTISGLEDNDSLKGSAGDDFLDGGAGSDQLEGGEGNDTYIVDHLEDDVIEGFNQGFDSIQSSVSYTLPENTEQLTLTGDTAINGIGNNRANVITGNSGVNVLMGAKGLDILMGKEDNDILIGGAGPDRFVYNSDAPFTSSAFGVDLLTDFSLSQNDKIVLDKTTFTTINSFAGQGFDDASEFATVTTDADAEISPADIVYNTSNGALFYNPNGTDAGFGTGAKFLTLLEVPALAESHFILQD